MPYKMGWYIENEILYAHCSVTLTIAEAQGLLRDVNENVARSDRPVVHAIFDVSRITKPLSLFETAQALRGATAHSHIGWMVTVGEQDKLVKFSTNMARQLLRRRQQSFDTLEQALAFLKETDADLHWDRANPAVLAAGKDS